MTREEFEVLYAKRHMGYDPRKLEQKIESVERLRDWHGYTDTHIDLCWKVQQIQDDPSANKRQQRIKHLRW